MVVGGGRPPSRAFPPPRGAGPGGRTGRASPCPRTAACRRATGERSRYSRGRKACRCRCRRPGRSAPCAAARAGRRRAPRTLSPATATRRGGSAALLQHALHRVRRRRLGLCALDGERLDGLRGERGERGDDLRHVRGGALRRRGRAGDGPGMPVSRPASVPSPVRLVNCWQAPSAKASARRAARVPSAAGINATAPVLLQQRPRDAPFRARFGRGASVCFTTKGGGTPSLSAARFERPPTSGPGLLICG